MKKLKTPYDKFETESKEFCSKELNEYENLMSRCRDEAKEKIHSEFLNKTLDKLNKKISGLNIYARFFIDLRDELDRDKGKEFSEVFNQRFNLIPSSKKPTILIQLSQLSAYQEMINFLHRESQKYDVNRNKQFNNTSIKWIGSIELEFIQLIYALNEAGYLKNEKQQITTLVKDVANAFNLKLGSNWQSNLSDNINNRNADYHPAIFEKLKVSFEKYRSRQIEKNKKKKPK